MKAAQPGRCWQHQWSKFDITVHPDEELPPLQSRQAGRYTFAGLDSAIKEHSPDDPEAPCQLIPLVHGGTDDIIVKGQKGGEDEKGVKKARFPGLSFLEKEQEKITP
jgi:hypothetical protein